MGKRGNGRASYGMTEKLELPPSYLASPALLVISLIFMNVIAFWFVPIRKDM
jgi:hypothetical protein